MIEGGRSRRAGRFATTAEALRRVATTLTAEDHVVLEATCNTEAIARVLQQHAGRVVISNPLRTRAIADAKIKTDKIDATVLAQLLASGFLPEVWLPDEETARRRRQVARRAQVVRQRTQVKNHIHAILHRNLVPPCPYADLFGKGGRVWLASQPLPADEQHAVTSLLRSLDQCTEEVAGIERDVAEETLACRPARRLMTISGVDAAIAMTLVAAVGDIARFPSSRKLVSYLGLDPRVRQSGLHPATHGRISKQGHAHARSMLVQAAWAATKTLAPCGPSSCGSGPTAGNRLPSSRRPASWPCWSGICGARSRTISGRGRRSRPPSCAPWNCAPVGRPAVGNEGRR